MITECRAWNEESKSMSYFDLRDNLSDENFHGDNIVTPHTGKNDKSGKEKIYVGDIIKSHFSGRDNIPDALYEIFFDQERASFRAKLIKGNKDLNNEILHPAWWSSHCKKIGNRYKNPELLWK